MPTIESMRQDEEEGAEFIHPFFLLGVAWREHVPEALMHVRLAEVLDDANAEAPFRHFMQTVLERGAKPVGARERMDGDARLALVEVTAHRDGKGPDRDLSFMAHASIVAASLAACGVVGRDRDTLPRSAYDLLLSAALVVRGRSLSLAALGLRKLLYVNDLDTPPEDGSDTALEHAALDPVTGTFLGGHRPWAELLWPLLITESLLDNRDARPLLVELRRQVVSLGPRSEHGRAAADWRHWLDAIGLSNGKEN